MRFKKKFEVFVFMLHAGHNTIKGQKCYFGETQVSD